MKNIKVPGSGCRHREITTRKIVEVSKEVGVVPHEECCPSELHQHAGH